MRKCVFGLAVEWIINYNMACELSKSLYSQENICEAIPSMNVTEQCSLCGPLALTRSGIELSLHRPNGILRMNSVRTYC